MSHEDNIRLRHMLDAAKDAIQFVSGQTVADLESDRMRTLALVKTLEIIGEAAYKVSETTKNASPAIPWQDIIGIRHRLVHAYYDINIHILWATITKDLPNLVRLLETALQRAPQNSIH